MDDLTPAQDLYQQWLATPSNLRPEGLRSRQDVASVLGVTPALLRHWETTPGFYDNVFAHARTTLGHQMADVMLAVARQAKTGSVQAAKLFFELLGVHHERLDHHHQIENDQLVVVLRPDTSAMPHTNAHNKQLEGPQAALAPPVDPSPEMQTAEAPAAATAQANVKADANASQAQGGYTRVPLEELYNDPILGEVAQELLSVDVASRSSRRHKAASAAKDSDDDNNTEAFTLPWD